MTESKTPRTDALIKAHGLTLTVELLEDKGYRHPAKWRIAVKAANGQVLTTEYTMGAAFRSLPASNVTGPLGSGGERITPKDRAKFPSLLGRGSVSLFDETLLEASVPTAPDLPGVLYSLASDAECVRWGQTLTEFGEEMGYEKLGEGVAAYEGCTASWHGLLRLGLDPEALSEATRGDDEA